MHYSLLEKYTDELSRLSDYKGCCIKKGRIADNTTYFSIKHSDQTIYRYAGSDDSTDITAVREYRFYEKLIEIIKSNIAAMESFLCVYRITNADTINDLLPKIYRLPDKHTDLYFDSEIDDWLNRCKKIKAGYPVFDEAGLTVRSFDGTMVRSRAEAIHLEAFFIYNVPAIFELPYKIGNNVLCPDFTALDVYMKLPVMVEHLGNWFHNDDYKRSKYRNECIYRLDEFSKIGFFPGANVFLTFGSKDNAFDIQAIHRKIAMLAAPPPSQETIDLLKRC